MVMRYTYTIKIKSQHNFIKNSCSFFLFLNLKIDFKTSYTDLPLSGRMVVATESYTHWITRMMDNALKCIIWVQIPH